MEFCTKKHFVFNVACRILDFTIANVVSKNFGGLYELQVNTHICYFINLIIAYLPHRRVGSDVTRIQSFFRGYH